REDRERAFAIFTELVHIGRESIVISALGDRGADEVWETAFPIDACEPSADLLASIASFWEETIDPGTTHGALRLVATLIRHGVSETPAAMRAHVDAVRSLAASASAPGWHPQPGDASLQNAAGQGAPHSNALLIAIGRSRPELVTSVASTVRAAAIATNTMIGSAFAGYALLLPIIAELEPPLERAARELVLAKCAAADDVFLDAILQLVQGDDVEDETTRSDDELETIANEVLASFGNRIPGFARSSAAHLRENFLDGTGAIRFERERIEILLPHVPLALLLRMFGVHGKTFALPWLPERTITLLMPEDA
ncbi:MAG TPA: hypothetical protein VNN25_27125, partial [Thermoanaerobaculia bacterium]|nr:hypothetical protein [Thermoanaerobaculia bacterium]